MGKGVKPGRWRTGTVGNNEPPFGGEVDLNLQGQIDFSQSEEKGK